MSEGYISLAIGSRKGSLQEGPVIRQLMPAILSGKPNLMVLLDFDVQALEFLANPNFSTVFYCSTIIGHACCVARSRICRHTVENTLEIFRSRCLYPCPLGCLTAKIGEKFGLNLASAERSGWAFLSGDSCYKLIRFSQF